MDYFNEIKHLAQKIETNNKVRQYQANNEKIKIYWEIGKLIVEAQGGVSRAKYGDMLIKEWSRKLTDVYGKGYTSTNLKYFRQYYLIFKNGHPLGDQINWTLIRTILPIKNENKRNYYINLAVKRNLSKRELISEIKNKSYERLLNKPEKIELMTEKEKYSIDEHLRNPIIIKLDKKDNKLKEKDLELAILAKLQHFFKELGEGYAFIDNEYKIKEASKNYYLDLLLFNYKLNAFVVVELKTRELRNIDKAQMEFYIELVNKNLKENYHNDTIGIIVTKYQDNYIANFVKTKNITPITYNISE